METSRPRTPPPPAGASGASPAPKVPLTPEQTRRIEINRLKAKAIREQREAEARQSNTSASLNGAGSTSGAIGGNVRYSSRPVVDAPPSLRDGSRASEAPEGSNGLKRRRPHDDIQPAQKFSRYVEYDFSKMTDTKGGFLSVEDDPHNKALHAPSNDEERPAHMTLKEWERTQLLRSLRNQKTGPFEPGISVLTTEDVKKCRECGGMEIDWKWDEIFDCQVCNSCKEKLPEKYSLLTKTEAREDYLLTDPELKDPELLPHLERPNPHKSTWNNMMLYLRYQIEDYAFSAKKWGSPEALDEEFVRRETEKKKRKETKFKTKLHELKKRTRVEAYRRSRQAGGGGGEFGDEIGGNGKHQHEWGRTVDNPETGTGVKTCIECGMEVEELEF